MLPNGKIRISALLRQNITGTFISRECLLSHEKVIVLCRIPRHCLEYESPPSQSAKTPSQQWASIKKTR